MNLVLYHANCTDGFASAFLMYLYFKGTNQEAEFKAVNYNQPIPTGIEDKNIYIVDFSYSREDLLKFGEKARTIIMLDHHITAAEQHGGYGTNYFAINNCAVQTSIIEEYSGAGLTYKYLTDYIKLHNLINVFNSRITALIQAVQDHDLWEFKYKDTMVIYELLQIIPRTFEAWEEVFIRESDQVYQEHLNKAINYREVKNTLTQLYASKYQLINFAGYRVPAVNAPANFASAIGDTLNKNHPFALTYVLSPTELYVSLRSDKATGINVADIAKRFGGGGHINSAGFKIHPRFITQFLEGKLTTTKSFKDRIVEKYFGWFITFKEVLSIL